MKKTIVAILSTLAVSTAFAQQDLYNPQNIPVESRIYGTPNVYYIPKLNPTREDVKRDYEIAKKQGFITHDELDYPPQHDGILVSAYPNLTGVYDNSKYTEYGANP